MDRRAREKAGRRAEVLAKYYLRLKGYQILAHRFKTKVGEIDLIARKRDLLIVVEVKQRSTLRDAETSLTWQTWNRVSAAAHIFRRSQKNRNLAIRYDAILIVGTWHIHHIKDAWRKH